MWSPIQQLSFDTAQSVVPQIVVLGDTINLLWWNNHLSGVPESTKGVFLSQSFDGGSSFSPPRQLLAFDSAGGNPGRLAGTGKYLYLLHIVRLDPFEMPFYNLSVSRSTDGGSTWLKGPLLGDYTPRTIIAHDSSVYVSVIYVDTVAGGRRELFDGFFVSHDYGQSYVMAAERMPPNNGDGSMLTGSLLYWRDTLHQVYAIRFPVVDYAFYEVAYRRSTNFGTTWSQPETLSVVDGLLSTLTNINTDDRGNLYVTWYDGKYGSIDGYHAGIVARISRDGGNTWEEEFPLESEPLGVWPVLSSNGTTVVAAWSEYVNYFLDRPVYRYTRDGGRSWSAKEIVNDGGFDNHVGLTGTRVLFSWWLDRDIFVRSASLIGSCVHEIAPTSYTLPQNYPNPFNSGTTIEYTLPSGSHDVTLRIYNILGEKVATLDQGTGVAGGTYRINWNPGILPSGVYFCRLSTESFSKTRKLILVK
jgi:hypothetical protein